MALAAFAFGDGRDASCIGSDLVDDTSIGWVEMGSVGLTSCTHTLDPAAGFVGNLFFVLLFVVGNINTHAHYGRVLRPQCRRNDILQRPQRLCPAANQDTIDVRRLHPKGYYFAIIVTRYRNIFAKKRDDVLEIFSGKCY